MEQLTSQFRYPDQGVTQQGRQQRALLPEYAPVDQRTVADFLQFAHRFAEYLRYYNDRNQPEEDPSREELPGYWQRFFAKDLSVFLATLVNAPVKERLAQRQEILRGLEQEKDEDQMAARLESLFSFVWSLAIEIDTWRQDAAAFSSLGKKETPGIREIIDEFVHSRLRRDFHLLRSYATVVRREISRNAVPNLPLSSLSALWGQEEELPAAQLSFAPQMGLKDKILLAAKKVQLVSQSFLNSYQQVVQAADRFLSTSLESKEDHPPPVGLFLAFTHLYGHLQKDLNGLTEKHLDLFYREILKQQPLPSRPDEVHLYFDLASHVEDYFLEAGTLLSAGNQGGEEELLYEVCEDIVLNRARIEEVKTLFISKNPNIGTGSTYRLVSGIFVAQQANSKDGAGAPLMSDETWPTFGADQVLKPQEERQMAPAPIGMAVSDPVLALSEGDREIRMRWIFDRDSAITLKTLITDISRRRLISEDNAFALIFSENLRVSASGEIDWVNLDHYHIEANLGPERWEITLIINLEQGDPALVSWHEGLPGERYHTEWPVLRVLLDPEATPYAYSFWQDLQLEQIFIDVAVHNLRRLDLFSDVGKLDNSQPFQPFGPLPVQGSYLMAGNVELFKKNLTRLRFNLEWMNLPRKEGGFKEHYAPYDLGIYNGSFRVAMSVLSRNELHPFKREKRPEYPLFSSRSSEPPVQIPPYDPSLALGLERPVERKPSPEEKKQEGAPLSPFHSIEVDLEALEFQPDLRLKSTESLNLNTASGFFRMELAAPAVAFGHQEYPSIFTRIVTENAIVSGQRQLIPFRTLRTRPVPEQPYTPVLKEISVDYTASTQIDFFRGKDTQNEGRSARYFHLHPFGVRTILDEDRIRERYLLPQYDKDGYLYLGIRDLDPPRILSLYFQMEENPSRQVFESPPEISWSYLGKEQWLDFSPQSLLMDSTNGFTTSGIIQIEVPRDIQWDSETMPSHLFWLRIAVKGDPERLSQTYLLQTQGVKARWVQNGLSSHLEKPLPAYSIEKLQTSVAAVAEVVQPYPSFAGKPGEQRGHFYTRVSERLRHKNRIVTAWDVERMVLEHFPHIHQVKCLTHTRYPGLIEPGEIVVVVVPDLKGWDSQADPVVSFHVRQQIQEFLESFSSPFSKFLVRNPAFDRLKVSARVSFKKGKNSGGFLQKLAQDLEAFISPWRKDAGRALNLGGSISKDAVLRFMQELDYVDFVSGFAMVLITANEDKQREERGEYSLYDPQRDESRSPAIWASTPWSVIVPFEKHNITFTFRPTYTDPDPVGIDTMVVGADFIIGGKKKGREGMAGETLFVLTIEV